MSSALLLLATPGATPVLWPGFAWVGFAPWFALLPRLGWGTALLSGLVLGLGYTIPGHWDAFATAIAAASGESPLRDVYLFLLFLSLALPFMLFGWLDATLLRPWQSSKWQRPLLRSALLASLIVGIWSPFPYTPTLLIVEQTQLLQIVDIAGEVIPLWLLLWSSAWLAEVLAAPAQWRRHRVALFPLLLLAVACLVYGDRRIDTLEAREHSGDGVSLRAMPLQLDLPNHASVRTMLSDRSGAATSAMELSRVGLQAPPQCELAIWPEVPIPLERVDALCQRGTELARRLGVPLLLQCSRVSGDRFQVTAELFSPGTSTPLVHAKSALVPLYEQPLLAPGHTETGAGGSVFAFPGGRGLVPTLCYELHSRDHLRAAAMNGGNIIVHMASFTAFERHPVDEIDLAMARIRAIEFRMPIVRSANRGAVGWIDAGGRPRQLSQRLGTANRCVKIFSPADGPSVFARIAPIAPWLPGAMALIWVLLARWRGRIGARSGSAFDQTRSDR